MGTTQPLKKMEEINKLKEYFKNKGAIRDFTLVVLGLNTAIRISDILKLRWGDVYDFESQSFYTHVHIKEQKTNKNNQVYLNSAIIDALHQLLNEQGKIYPEKIIFISRKRENKPISRFRAYAILKTAGNELGLGKNFSCHSLRKTFGYHAWKQGASPVIIMSIYNHSSFEITKRYLSIEQDDKDAIFSSINF